MEKYRLDVDGLRAVAVLGVVIYHLNEDWLSGGFTGVDVFLVISGYLITSIICRDIATHSFSFKAFFHRRVVRLFPALAAMLCVNFLVGMVILVPYDLVLLSRGIVASLGFASNVYFWRTGSYFDSSTEISPLLHTWSLGLEEQFYLFFPAALVFGSRISPRRVPLGLALAMMVSLLCCVIVQQFRPTAAFYLLPFRAWEFLAGGLVAVGNWRLGSRMKMAVSFSAWIGLLLILYSMTQIKAGVEYPGIQAILPVIGTMLIINAGKYTGGGLTAVLSRRPLVVIGKLSYSLYLWHWPVITYQKYVNNFITDSLGAGSAIAAVLVSLLLAILSYTWIECWFQKRFRTALGGSGEASAYAFYKLSSGVILGLAFLSVLIHNQEGFKKRLRVDLAHLNDDISPSIPYLECNGDVPADVLTNKCSFGDRKSQTRILIWGDSHALAWAPGLESILPDTGVLAVLATKSACPPLIDVRNPVSLGCDEFNQGVMRWIERNEVRRIVMIASWISYSSATGQYQLVNSSGLKGNSVVFGDALTQTVNALNDLGARALIVTPTPGAPSDVVRRTLLSRMNGAEEPQARLYAKYQADVQAFRSSLSSITKSEMIGVLDPTTLLCNTRECRYKQSDGTLLYRDGGHLSVAGATFMAQSFAYEILGSLQPRQ
jgi:peptidoglycan/LPS O-acetylase OafA/YrhL